MKLGLISSHARTRMKQRGMSENLLQTLLAHGRVEHDHHGGKIVYFDHQAQHGAAWPERCLDAYAVLDRHGEVITVGQRFRKTSGRRPCAPARTGRA